MAQIGSVTRVYVGKFLLIATSEAAIYRVNPLKEY